MNRIVVLGGAESGVGAAILAKVKGFEVFLSDKGKIAQKYEQMLQEWEIPYEQGCHSEEKILSADEIVKSPGIPETAPMIKKIREAGISIISEIEFAGRYDNARRICITGSNGKTTTTTLIHYILEKAGYNVGLGGNIGMSYAFQVATQKRDWYVLEISSFQLDDAYTFTSDVAVLMNVTPDHLDRYGYVMDNYTAAKFRIAQNLRERDTFIYDEDDPTTMDWMGRHPVEGGRCVPFAFARKEILPVGVEELSLRGRHNVYNCMAATLAARAAGVSEDVIIAALKDFPAIEHRLEPVRTLGGVEWINDSKATNVDAAFYALEAQTKPVVWIVGGTDKGNDYSTLLPLVREKVKAIVCLGVDNSKIHAAYDGVMAPEMICDARSMPQCIEECAKRACEGDVVLLSPCCASFDLFTCYEDRGEQFKEGVMKL